MVQSSLFSIEDEKLTISGCQIDTILPVAQAIVVDQCIIVRLKVSEGKVLDSNVLCFSKQGKLMWTIDPSPYGGMSDPYVAIIESDEDREFLARSFNGIEFAVSMIDGSVKTTGFNRF